MHTLKEELKRLGFRQVYSGPVEALDDREWELFNMDGRSVKLHDHVLAFVGPTQPDADDFAEELNAAVDSLLKREKQRGRTRVFDALVSLTDVFGFERSWALVLALRKN
ncbi:hypothetical protein KJ765_01740 [Candidatus Micrarchaeota archaeon]|nr:hypothetical protein [Candidatus Micrarchaeota archaeon]